MYFINLLFMVVFVYVFAAKSMLAANSHPTPSTAARETGRPRAS